MAQRATVIPVSCVESGRWRQASRAFSSSHAHAVRRGRAAKMCQVTASLSAAGRSCVRPARCVAPHRRQIRPAERAVGHVRNVRGVREKSTRASTTSCRRSRRSNGRLARCSTSTAARRGSRLFDAADTWRQLSAKLIRALRWTQSIVKGVEHDHRANRRRRPSLPRSHRAPHRRSPRPAKATMCGSAAPTSPPPALVARGRVIHLSAFPLEGPR